MDNDDKFIWGLAFSLMMAILIGFCMDGIIWRISTLFN